jgi:hypothetical protein
MTQDKGIKINVKVLNTYLIIGLIAVLVIAMVAIQLNKPKAVEPVVVKKANLLVTVITPPCTDCFDNTAFAAAVKQLPNVNVSEAYFEYNTTEGKALIEEYSLARLPAAVITGETKNLSLPNFKQKGEAYYFDETPAPYYNVSTKRVAGRISITYITAAACPNCYDVAEFGSQLKETGASISSQRIVEAASPDGQAMIKKYSITQIPTMIMSADALAYPVVAQVWPMVGSVEADGMLVLRNVSVPYYDFTDNKVHGLVTAVYITDKSCTECYDVKMHKEVLEQSFGMKFKEEKSADVSEKAGKDLVKKYSIKYVPAILLDKEASEYKSLVDAWTQVGTVEPDGVFVFRNINLMQGVTYKDFESNTTTSTPAQ